MKNYKTLKGKVTSQPAEEIAKIEKENLFSKFIYAPPPSFKAAHLSTLLTDNPVTRNTHPNMKDISDSCINMDDCKQMDEGISEVSEKDSACKNHDSLKSNPSGSTSSMGAFKNALNETLDDFQECEMGNRVKCKLAEKSQEDASFICIMCQGDFTHLTLDERTMHVNQCIDYHSSAVATSQAVPSTTVVLECPLCFKSLPSNEVRKLHVKKCGKSRGLSVQSVIQAVHLQEKHALERIALGLPLNVKAKPVKPPKKLAVKKFTLQPKSAMQSDLQLAKALSLSLKQKENESQLTILPTSSEDVSIEVLKAPAEFQNPGRPPPKKKKGISHPFLLLLRTEEDRMKIIQDKVDAIIVSSHKGENLESTNEEKSTTKQQQLAYLWNLSSAAVEKSSYYVDQLLDWIKPSDVEVGSKLCNLSQVAGHRIFTQLSCDYTFSSASKGDEKDVTIESNSAPSLANSLRSLIGNSWMSDVDIHTASGIVIPAHKLFLALRCPGLKNAFDAPIECGKYILNWKSTSFDAALHFLNFIYTGATEWKEEIIGELTHLAKKYKVEDLMDILNDSETLELLISEDPQTEKFADTPMDIDISDRGDCITDDCQNSKKYKILSKKTDKVVYSSEQSHSAFKDKDLKESDSDVQAEIEDECTFIKTNNLSHLSTSTNSNSTTTCDTYKTFLDTSKTNFINIKTHDPDLAACITDSESSNDSCKILQYTTFSQFKASPIASCEISEIKIHMSPKISPEEKSKKSYISLKSPPKTYLGCSLAENAVSPDFSYNNPCKNTPKDSYNSDHEELSSKLRDNILNKSNEDIFIVEEFTDKRDSINKRDSLSFNETLPLETSTNSSRKLSSFSSAFQNEYEDLDAAICLSQNMSFQNKSINRIDTCGSNLCKEGPLAFRKNSYASPGKLQISQNHNQQYFDSNISPVKNNSFYSDSNKIDCFDYSECEINFVSSPEILVCDSEDENMNEVLGSDYFRGHENLSLNRSTPTKDDTRKSFLNEVVERDNPSDDSFNYNASINWTDKTKLKSPSKENDDVFCHTFRNQNTSERDSVVTSEIGVTSLKRSPNKSSAIVPELICCDSNSDDKLEVIECLQTPNSNKKIVLENEDDCISILPDYNALHQETPKTSSYKNSSLSSPESPWTFKTDNPSEDFGFSKKSKSLKSSAVSSRLCSNLELKYSERKGNTLDKNKCNKISDSSVNTPKDLVKYKISDSPITPLPDYGKMMTPEIKEALKRIGVKALPRKKAVAVLSHVYDETHPWNDGASGSSIQDLNPASQSKSKSLSQKKNLSLPKKRKETTEMCAGEAKKRVKKCSSTVQSENEFQSKATKKTTKSTSSLHNKRTGSSGSQKDIPLSDTSPESLKNNSFGSSNSRDDLAQNLSISSEFSDSGLSESKGNPELLRNYILSKDVLYNRILNYMPINLMEFQQELKENGIKISVKQLTDYLDEQCITFTYPRKEEYKKKQQVRTQRFRKKMIAKLSQQGSSNVS